jgi:hypothetical protein
VHPSRPSCSASPIFPRKCVTASWRPSTNASPFATT